ncbi:competence type IV pilus assembly protein ComGB [Mesobacillus maritimus]|uniref:Type II secretion system F family protein n=1 Tax=Mesobacillus maritimus TaxID=1643336 RepID=A0ABS7K2M4_9BACI|nr:competence type IV pilus assembly protein ComGB [Mesobacillus maritimus]MBY0096391.1 type II secretion system F family protein [Mesobacillus maritimus]
MSKKIKWPVQEQAHFLKHVGDLLSRGYPIAEAIDSISLYLDNKKKREIRECLASLKEGYPFFRVLSDLNFNKDLVSYVYFAEQHGGLANAIVEGSTMVLKRDADYKRLKGLLSYPIFLVFLTVFLFYFVDNALLPRFLVLYQNMEVEATFFSRVISAFGTFMPIAFYLLLTLLFVTSLYHMFVFKKYRILDQRKKLIRIPLIGLFFKLLYSHYFSTQLSYLLSGGMSVIDALQVFEKNIHEPFSVELGQEIKACLSTGMDLDVAVSSYSFFEEELGRIIKHGQENGKLDQELFFYSRHCLSKLEEKTEKSMKIIQPLLFSVIGILIVSLYLAILLPMFQLIQGI